MKTITFLSAILLTASTLVGQVTYFDGGHSMPVGYMERGLIFLDSLMSKPHK